MELKDIVDRMCKDMVKLRNLVDRIHNSFEFISAYQQELVGMKRDVRRPIDRYCFKKGDRVFRTETGKKGTVRTQFWDGYVSIDFDDSTAGWYDALSLKLLSSSSYQKQEKHRKSAKR